MTYDLFFRPKNGKLPCDDIMRYFSSRPNYCMEGGEAMFNNEDTGVYFRFMCPSLDEDPQVVFNMNYCRPHPFGLEAELEVAAFVKQFNLLVEDPQINGMGSGEYSREGFLSGWNGGNEVACKELTNVPAHLEGDFTLPYELMERCWAWNKARSSLQEQLKADDIFVPKIMFCLHQKQIKTFITWPDAIPIALSGVVN